MTVVLAVANQKGGVGKTTTTINLGDSLAHAGNEVLIVDFDPQANASASLGVKAAPGRSSYELLLGEVAMQEVVVATGQERLWIIPATFGLAGAEVELASMMGREFRLKQAIEGGIESYRYVIIDCPPSVGLLTINALTAAQEVVIPVQCEYLALEGLGQFTSTLELVRLNLNRELKLRGLLLTMYDRRTTLSQQVADEVRSHFPNTFQAVIPRSVRLSEAPSHGLPIRAYEPNSPAAAAYRELAEEMLRTEGAPMEVTS